MGWKKDFPLWFNKFFVPILAIYVVLVLFLARSLGFVELFVVSGSFVVCVFVFKFVLNYHSFNSFKVVEEVRRQAESLQGIGVDKAKFVTSVNCDVVQEPKGVFAVRCDLLGRLFVFDMQTRLVVENTSESMNEYLVRVKNRLLAGKIAEQQLKSTTLLLEKELEEGGV